MRRLMGLSLTGVLIGVNPAACHSDEDGGGAIVGDSGVDSVVDDSSNADVNDTGVDSVVDDGSNADSDIPLEDDTHGCLDTYDGPVIVVSATIVTNTTSDSGYRFDSAELEDNTRFDARDALFQVGPSGDNMAEGVPFNFSGASDETDSVCIAGGIYQGIYDRTISWAQGHHGDGQLAYIHNPDTTLDGLRVDNIAQDAPNFKANAHNFLITNSWFSYVRDDCIENDNRRSGQIADNLYDGCYTFLSHQAETTRDGSADTVVMRDNLIRMQNMPKPYDYESYGNDPNSMGHGDIFKQASGSDKPTVDVVRNVFWIEPNLTPRESLRYDDFDVELGDCRDNVLIWTGTGDWPHANWESLPPGCITEVVRGQEGLDLWAATKQNWIDCHPKVARVPGDPVSEPARCNPNAYGGGRGGTDLP